MHCLEISLCDQCSHRSDQTCVIQSMLTSDFQAYSHYSNKNPFYGNVFKVSKPTHQHYQLKSLVDQPQDHWLILSGWYSTLTFSVVCSSFSKKNHPSWSWMLITPLKNSLLELNKKSPKWKGTGTSSEPSTSLFVFQPCCHLCGVFFCTAHPAKVSADQRSWHSKANLKGSDGQIFEARTWTNWGKHIKSWEF